LLDANDDSEEIDQRIEKKASTKEKSKEEKKMNPRKDINAIASRESPRKRKIGDILEHEQHRDDEDEGKVEPPSKKHKKDIPDENGAGKPKEKEKEKGISSRAVLGGEDTTPSESSAKPKVICYTQLSDRDIVPSVSFFVVRHVSSFTQLSAG